MMYHPIKFSCNKISSSAGLIEKSCLIKWAVTVTLNLKTANKSSCMTLWPMMLHHNSASPFQVWLQKVQQQRRRRYHPEEHLLEYWTFSVNLTLTTTEQSNLFTKQSSLWWCAIKPGLVAKKTSSSEDILKSYSVIIWSFTVTLTFKSANQPFGKTI